MKNLLNRLGRAWRGIHLADRLLLAFLAVLLIQSGHNLFARELSGESAELDVVVRTTMASIFGYFISTGVNGKTGTSQSVSAPVKIGFSLPEEGASLRMEGEPAAVGDQEPLAPPVQEQGEEKPDAGWQLGIVGIIGLGALVLIILARNCGQNSPEAQATLSQLRDFVSGSVGFLIAHGGGKGASN